MLLVWRACGMPCCLFGVCACCAELVCRTTRPFWSNQQQLSVRKRSDAALKHVEVLLPLTTMSLCMRWICTHAMQGAPERVVRRCSTYLKDGEGLPIDADFDAAFKTAYEDMAGKGQRVIACAMLKLDSPSPSFRYVLHRRTTRSGAPCITRV